MDAKQGKSLLTYTPVSDVDYGSLSCRAMNLAGQQVTPCVYTLLPATRPDPPTNCTVYNLTDDSLDLLCIPGMKHIVTAKKNYYTPRTVIGLPQNFNLMCCGFDKAISGSFTSIHNHYGCLKKHQITLGISKYVLFQSIY